MDLSDFRREAVAIHSARPVRVYQYGGLEYHEHYGNVKDKYKYFIDEEEVPRLEFLKEIEHL